MTSWAKVADAIGSATPDPNASVAAAQPLPPPSISNKPAPGQTGPRGLSPRTTYTRVNTGAPPVPDAGGSGQKSQSPRGLEFLPAKVAHKERTSMSDTTMFQRPNLQDLVKEAMEGTARKVDVNLEAARQLASLGGQPIEKQASAQSQMTPTGYINKLASALTYLSKKAEEGTAMIQPGKGPGALDVLAATSSEENIDAGQSGQATAGNLPPKNPPMQSSGVAKDPANAMETNDEMMHGEQPVDPMGNEKTSAVYRRNLQKLGLSKEAETLAERAGEGLGKHVAGPLAQYAPAIYGVGGGLHGAAMGGALGGPVGALAGGAGGALLGTGVGYGVRGATRGSGTYLEKKKKKQEREKTSSVYFRNLSRLGLSKYAEDAINPAQISGGAAPAQGAQPPPGASPSEEQVPSEPSDVTGQKRLIDSNQASIDYTKREAKADPKSDVNKVLDEPPLTSSTDHTLQDTLDHTQQAGVKISAALTKTAAAQALLYKLAETACGEKKDAKKKEKQAQGMSGLSNPSGQSGFSASSMGM